MSDSGANTARTPAGATRSGEVRIGRTESASPLDLTLAINASDLPIPERNFLRTMVEWLSFDTLIAWPGPRSIADAMGYTGKNRGRTVERIRARLIDRGILIREGDCRGGRLPSGEGIALRVRLDFDALLARRRAAQCNPGHRTGVQAQSTPATEAPNSGKRISEPRQEAPRTPATGPDKPAIEPAIEPAKNPPPPPGGAGVTRQTDLERGGSGGVLNRAAREGEAEQIVAALRAAGVASDAAIRRITETRALDLVHAVIHRHRTEDLSPNLLVWALDPGQDGAPTDDDLDFAQQIAEARKALGATDPEIIDKAQAEQARHADAWGSLAPSTEAASLLNLAEHCAQILDLRAKLSAITKPILAIAARKSGIEGPIDDLSTDDLRRLLKTCEPTLRRDCDQFLDLWHRQPEALRACVAEQLECTVERVAEACAEIHNAKHRRRAYRHLDAIDLCDRLDVLDNDARDTIAHAVALDSGDDLLAACGDYRADELRRRVRAAIDSHRQATEAGEESAKRQASSRERNDGATIPPPPTSQPRAGGAA